MKLAASAWEFRYRFWLFGAWFLVCFNGGYGMDRRNLAVAVAKTLCGLAGRPARDADIRLLFFAGALLTGLAAALRTWATAYIRPEVMVDGVVHTHTVVAEGPYRHVRNPMYLGTNLMAVGYAFLASRLGGILLIAGIVLFNYRLILREEHELREARGEQYERYRRAVPRLWFGLRPRTAGTERAPDWGAGFLGEAFFWGLAAALLAFAATFSMRVYFFVLGASFAVYFICLRIIRRKKRLGSNT
jgi:protein-S-isoprenylcysteine O-methyltransferase Ste14